MMNVLQKEQQVKPVVKPNSLAPRIVSGSIGSIITALAVTPLEVVKIRQQSSVPSSNGNTTLENKSPKKLQAKTLHRGRGTVTLWNGLQLPKSSFPCLVAPGHTDFISRQVTHQMCPKLYESTLCTGSHSVSLEVPRSSGGTVNMLRSIVRNEGIAGLYTGLRPTLLMTVPNTALTLTLYDEMMSTTLIESADSPYAPLLIGALSRCAASTVTLPLELIRTRQASFMSSNLGGSVPGLVEDLRYLVRTHGIAGLYKGLPVTLVRDSSFSGFYFVCLELIRTELKEFNGIGGGKYFTQQGLPVPSSINVAHNLISGAGAAAIATLLTGPLDTAKTRKQMIQKEGTNNQNMFRLLHSIYQTEGIRGLWKGNQARITKLMPASAIMIASYEIGKDIFRDFFH
eukprot:scaffold43086_cov53-Cyclotella_meneghiniana.AAC.1